MEHHWQAEWECTTLPIPSISIYYYILHTLYYISYIIDILYNYFWNIIDRQSESAPLYQFHQFSFWVRTENPIRILTKAWHFRMLSEIWIQQSISPNNYPILLALKAIQTYVICISIKQFIGRCYLHLWWYSSLIGCQKEREGEGWFKKEYTYIIISCTGPIGSGGVTLSIINTFNANGFTISSVAIRGFGICMNTFCLVCLLRYCT